jgi:hypothetical protein
VLRYRVRLRIRKDTGVFLAPGDERAAFTWPVGLLDVPTTAVVVAADGTQRVVNVGVTQTFRGARSLLAPIRSRVEAAVSSPHHSSHTLTIDVSDETAQGPATRPGARNLAVSARDGTFVAFPWPGTWGTMHRMMAGRCWSEAADRRPGRRI